MPLAMRPAASIIPRQWCLLVFRFKGDAVIQSQTGRGLFLAICAFSWWGLTPPYFKLVGFADPLEILCHRVIWALPICALLLCRSHGFSEVRQSLKSRKVALAMAASTIIVGLNWGFYIWAIIAGHVLQGSLGYYIAPLLNVMLGVVFLGERLSRWQLGAVIIAALGTINLSIALGEPPWIALVLAGLATAYGLIRKTVAIGALGGFFIETLLLTPPSLLYLIWLWHDGSLAFFSHGIYGGAMLFLAGLVTAVPMLCFTQAARLLRLSTLGICQYWSPTLMFILAVFVYQEPFTFTHLATFTCIWAGCALYIADSLRMVKKARPQIKSGRASD
jgi:chloramphenicol-sensitive protein RarD